MSCISNKNYFKQFFLHWVIEQVFELCESERRVSLCQIRRRPPRAPLKDFVKLKWQTRKDLLQ